VGEQQEKRQTGFGQQKKVMWFLIPYKSQAPRQKKYF
jgi:hypothetical protein